jgi:signal transduction histidine kinase
MEGTRNERARPAVPPSDGLSDLEKVKAGEIPISVRECTAASVLASLRAWCETLPPPDGVALRFVTPGPLLVLKTDAAVLVRILQQLVANALKFTESGEVVVSVELSPVGGGFCFLVRDTGIGIAPEHHDDIFEEGTRIRHPLQDRVKGHGVGLPLCRRLAALLGAAVSVRSRLGAGSTFTVTVPQDLTQAGAHRYDAAPPR